MQVIGRIPDRPHTPYYPATGTPLAVAAQVLNASPSLQHSQLAYIPPSQPHSLSLPLLPILALSPPFLSSQGRAAGRHHCRGRQLQPVPRPHRRRRRARLPVRPSLLPPPHCSLLLSLSLSLHAFLSSPPTCSPVTQQINIDPPYLLTSAPWPSHCLLPLNPSSLSGLVSAIPSKHSANSVPSILFSKMTHLC